MGLLSVSTLRQQFCLTLHLLPLLPLPVSYHSAPCFCEFDYCMCFTLFESRSMIPSDTGLCHLGQCPWDSSVVSSRYMMGFPSLSLTPGSQDFPFCKRISKLLIIKKLIRLDSTLSLLQKTKKQCNL